MYTYSAETAISVWHTVTTALCIQMQKLLELMYNKQKTHIVANETKEQIKPMHEAKELPVL